MRSLDNYTDLVSGLGSIVVPDDLVSNVAKLHEFLFGTAGYTPSSTVQTVNGNIAYTISSAKASGGSYYDDSSTYYDDSSTYYDDGSGDYYGGGDYIPSDPSAGTGGDAGANTGGGTSDPGAGGVADPGGSTDPGTGGATDPGGSTDPGGGTADPGAGGAVQ